MITQWRMKRKDGNEDGKKDVIVLNSHGVGQYAYTDHMPKWGETLSVKNGMWQKMEEKEQMWLWH